MSRFAPLRRFALALYNIFKSSTDFHDLTQQRRGSILDDEALKKLQNDECFNKHPTTSSERIVIFASDSAPTIVLPPAIPCVRFSTCSESGESHQPRTFGCVDGSESPASTRPRRGARKELDSISASPQSRCPQRTGSYAGDSGARTFLRHSANP